VKNLKAKLVFAFLIGAAIVGQLATVAQAEWYKFR